MRSCRYLQHWLLDNAKANAGSILPTLILFAAGQYVSQLQRLHDIDVMYHPPPRSIVPHARGEATEGVLQGGSNRGCESLVPDVVDDFEGGLDVGHMLAEVAQGCGLSKFPVPRMQRPVPRDHVQQAALACTPTHQCNSE